MLVYSLLDELLLSHDCVQSPCIRSVSEYVRVARAATDGADLSTLTSSSSSPCVVRVGDWNCQYELLRWRLERSVLSAFASGAPRVAMVAELSQLAEPLLARVCAFLQASDFVHATQTNKVRLLLCEWRRVCSLTLDGRCQSQGMRRLDKNQSLWRALLQHGQSSLSLCLRLLIEQQTV